MKIRESGMPDEARWASFFDCEAVVGKLLGATGMQGDVVEFGCGYGSFTVPAARRMSGLITALDIEPGMIAVVREKAASLGLHNIRERVRALRGVFTVENGQQRGVLATVRVPLQDASTADRYT